IFVITWSSLTQDAAAFVGDDSIECGFHSGFAVGTKSESLTDLFVFKDPFHCIQADGHRPSRRNVLIYLELLFCRIPLGCGNVVNSVCFTGGQRPVTSDRIINETPRHSFDIGGPIMQSIIGGGTVIIVTLQINMRTSCPVLYVKRSRSDRFFTVRLISTL